MMPFVTMPLRNLRSARCWHTCFSESEALTSNMEIRSRHCVVLHLGTALQPACSMQRLAWSQQSQPAEWTQRVTAPFSRQEHALRQECYWHLAGLRQEPARANRATHDKHEEEKGPFEADGMGCEEPCFYPDRKKDPPGILGPPHADCPCSMQARSMQTQGQRDVQRAACKKRAAKMAEVCQAGQYGQCTVRRASQGDPHLAPQSSLACRPLYHT